MSKRTNPNFLNGVPELAVLQLLSHHEMYGYQIVKAIQKQSQDQITFGEGCIYPILHHLEYKKLLSSRRQVVEGRSRLYYQLTGKGRKRLESLSEDWQRVAHGVTLLMGGSHVA